MELSQQELVQLYEALVKPFGHPDPLGYMTRAVIESGGDPDYVELSGKQGFMPVHTKRAMSMTGAENVAGLEDNIIATLAMDRILINEYNGDVDRAIIDFHFNNPTGNFNKEEKEFLDTVSKGRIEMKDVLYPRLATVKDVIELLDGSMIDERLDRKEIKFMKKLLET